MESKAVFFLVAQLFYYSFAVNLLSIRMEVSQTFGAVCVQHLSLTQWLCKIVARSKVCRCDAVQMSPGRGVQLSHLAYGDHDSAGWSWSKFAASDRLSADRSWKDVDIFVSDLLMRRHARAANSSYRISGWLFPRRGMSPARRNQPSGIILLSEPRNQILLMPMLHALF